MVIIYLKTERLLSSICTCIDDLKEVPLESFKREIMFSISGDSLATLLVTVDRICVSHFLDLYASFNSITGNTTLLSEYRS